MWPHRIWAVDGSTAPGWIHGHVEGIGDGEYQASQATSVVATFASLLVERRDEPDDELVGRLRSTVAVGVSGLDNSLESDGLSKPYQNMWENMSGRFAHVAAASLQAYAMIATVPVNDDLYGHAAEQATAVYGGLDGLWFEKREVYALRIDGNGGLDDCFDPATLALTGAVDVYADVEDVGSQTADWLVKHVAATLRGLYRSLRGDVTGLVQPEDNCWRAEGQDGEKAQSVPTA